MVFCVWILSASFLWQNNIPLYGHTTLNVPIHQVMCTCVYFLVITNHVQCHGHSCRCFVWTCLFVSLGYILKSGTVRHMVMVKFWRTCQMVFQVAAPFCIPTSRVRECQALHNLVSTCNCPVFLNPRKFWNNFRSKWWTKVTIPQSNLRHTDMTQHWGNNDKTMDTVLLSGTVSSIWYIRTHLLTP